jgi:hypothetical protein
MGQASITVKYVNAAKPGKKNGSVKGVNDDIYGVPPHMLANFQPGATYTIDYSERVFNGQTYKTVTTAVLASPAPAEGTGGGKYGPVGDATAERIFVCGALNAAIQGGHVELSDAVLSNVVNMLRSVWSHTLGASKKNADMGDNEGIPF